MSSRMINLSHLSTSLSHSVMTMNQHMSWHWNIEVVSWNLYLSRFQVRIFHWLFQVNFPSESAISGIKSSCSLYMADHTRPSTYNYIPDGSHESYVDTKIRSYSNLLSFKFHNLYHIWYKDINMCMVLSVKSAK